MKERLDSRKRTIIKTMSDKVMEIGLSSVIMYLIGLPLELVIGLPILIEILQIATYILNERIWSRVTWEINHEGHICETCVLEDCPCPLHRKINGKN